MLSNFGAKRLRVFASLDPFSYHVRVQYAVFPEMRVIGQGKRLDNAVVDLLVVRFTVAIFLLRRQRRSAMAFQDNDVRQM